ncbi:MAG TPA: DUF4142 domain-containing protein [Pirellulales bacterium]|jgi:predicted outer membrane protein
MGARKLTAMALAAGFLAAVATTMVAQERQPIPGRTDNPQIPTRTDPRYEVNKPVINDTARSSPADSQLASCLIVANEGEIALGKLAESRAKDKDVKQFAEQMVKDHTDFMQQLEKFAGPHAGSSTASTAATTGRPNNNSAIPTPGATDRPVAGATTQPMGSQELNFVQLKQQIGQKLLEMQKKDLEEKEGSQFDKCYIGGQIGAHMEVLATLEVVRNHASPEFVALLDKGIETTKTHLDHAQKIAKAWERQ